MQSPVAMSGGRTRMVASMPNMEQAAQMRFGPAWAARPGDAMADTAARRRAILQGRGGEQMVANAQGGKDLIVNGKKVGSSAIRLADNPEVRRPEIAKMPGQEVWRPAGPAPLDKPANQVVNGERVTGAGPDGAPMVAMSQAEWTQKRDADSRAKMAAASVPAPSAARTAGSVVGDVGRRVIENMNPAFGVMKAARLFVRPAKDFVAGMFGGGGDIAPLDRPKVRPVQKPSRPVVAVGTRGASGNW
jgi:hypothetical protein